jgi:hypothetical protein
VIGRVICSSAAVVNGMSAGRCEGGGRRANCALIAGPLTAIQRSRALVAERSCCAGEGPPEVGPGERSLGTFSEFVEFGTRTAPGLLGQQPLQRVLQVSLAPVKIGLGPQLGDRLQHAAVGIADDPFRLTGQRGQ